MGPPCPLKDAMTVKVMVQNSHIRSGLPHLPFLELLKGLPEC